MLAFLVGIFFGHIDMKHNSIVPSVIVHIFINSMVTVITELKGEAVLFAGFTLLIFAAAIVGLVMLLLFRKECRLPVPTPAQTRRGFAIAKTSVGCIIALGVYIAYMTLLILTE